MCPGGTELGAAAICFRFQKFGPHIGMHNRCFCDEFMDGWLMIAEFHSLHSLAFTKARFHRHWSVWVERRPMPSHHGWTWGHQRVVALWRWQLCFAQCDLYGQRDYDSERPTWLCFFFSCRDVDGFDGKPRKSPPEFPYHFQLITS